MQALEEAGRKIPQDVAIIGFDNRLEARSAVGLSSVHVPLFNMGYQALKQSFEHVEGRTELVELTKVRHTTGRSRILWLWEWSFVRIKYKDRNQIATGGDHVCADPQPSTQPDG
ncbi:MAG: substrate-binding domain-containing protein [Candidatus Moduliflexus flocculans]|nr:substrate-binding domain-containing protein [Candidatus Moduliflexus flocculans]